MSKFILFSLLWWITGSPFLSILLLLVIFYFLDRRYVRLFPSIARPIQMASRAAKLRQELSLNPHHTGNKQELARIFIERKRYDQALPFVEEVSKKIPDSSEALYEWGLCLLKTGDMERGEQLILEALTREPSLRYGEPYLELGEIFSVRDAQKGLDYLEKIPAINSSSAETHYRLGKLYNQLGRRADAQTAFKDACMIYSSLPRYLRRKQRRWALLARLKGGK
ncbi:hypothetical protein BEP19_04690 [Ammoniphilus oxalaticus]|uniref:Uncharacterized protein n=1 Tax=Ammoniphilus oxalaticus TaxID=66863 RepID=A0A419SM20_9BACL|nr:tetratricopeptide repeat protein [Ammoniphilus oxalaticus]RKD25120.1 hypothetical protein BEP19_04690 [Ammoniphilus oxalaticus]